TAKSLREILTPRQLELTALVAAGWNNPMCGAELGISEQSAKTICGTFSIVRESGRAWNWLAVTSGNGGRTWTPACRIPLSGTRKSLPARDGLRIHAVLTDGQSPRLAPPRIIPKSLLYRWI